MEKIEFKNKPNDCKIIDGETFWISRSVAVVGILIFRNKTTREDYVLLEERSEKMDYPLKWCVPCGYLDWDENGWESLMREVYEETGFYIPNYLEYLIYDNRKQPFYVNTNPMENRQNVALRFGLCFEFDEESFPYYLENNKNEEIKQLKFVDVNQLDNYEMAFNHDVIIKDFMNTYIYKYDAI